MGRWIVIWTRVYSIEAKTKETAEEQIRAVQEDTQQADKEVNNPIPSNESVQAFSSP